MQYNDTVYQRKRRNLSTHLNEIAYRILATDPLADWDLPEIQDKIQEEWGIRPYRATLLRHASNFYQKHHIPLFYKTSFTEDKYRLNTLISSEDWERFFKPKPKGRPRKRQVGH